MALYLLPSVVDMSGDGIKWIVAMSLEMLQHKNERKK